LGDIGLANDSRLFSFLDAQLTRFKTVIYILGNHEPYDGIFEAAKEEMRTFKRDMAHEKTQDDRRGIFMLLDQARYDITPTMTILGCTLFSAIDPDQESSIRLFVPDFERIQGWDVDSHNTAHKSDLAWLNRQVTSIILEEPKRKIVIFTHYSPTLQAEANDARYLKDDSGVRSAFIADLSKEPCWISPSVKLWAFGHTHFNCDFIDPETGKRVLANQKGYRRSEADGFEPEKVVVIATDSSVAQLARHSDGTPLQRTNFQTQELSKGGSGTFKRLGKNLASWEPKSRVNRAH
jgi:hypothetical protein